MLLWLSDSLQIQSQLLQFRLSPVASDVKETKLGVAEISASEIAQEPAFVCFACSDVSVCVDMPVSFVFSLQRLDHLSLFEFAGRC